MARCSVSSSVAARNFGVVFATEMNLYSHQNVYHMPTCSFTTLQPLDLAPPTNLLKHWSIQWSACRPLYTNMLQRVRNDAARLLTGTWRQEHIRGAVVPFYWLPITLPSQLKALLLHGLIPHYLQGPAPLYHNARPGLRPTGQALGVPRTWFAIYLWEPHILCI